MTKNSKTVNLCQFTYISLNIQNIKKPILQKLLRIFFYILYDLKNIKFEKKKIYFFFKFFFEDHNFSKFTQNSRIIIFKTVFLQTCLESFFTSKYDQKILIIDFCKSQLFFVSISSYDKAKPTPPPLAPKIFRFIYT